MEFAKNIKYLLDIGVTHLLNTAENDVNMNPKKYGKEGICYKGFRCPDLPQADISQFFDECVEFIDRALSFSCGKVFVSCLLVRLHHMIFCASKASTSTIVMCKMLMLMNTTVLWFDYTWLSGIQRVCVWIPNPFFIYYTSTTEKFDMIAFVCSECVTAIYGPTVKEPNMWSIFRLNFSAHYFFFLMQKK